MKRISAFGEVHQSHLDRLQKSTNFDLVESQNFLNEKFFLFEII